MAYSKGGPDNFIPERPGPAIVRPPEDNLLALAVAVVALVTAGLCVGLVLVAMW